MVAEAGQSEMCSLEIMFPHSTEWKQLFYPLDDWMKLQSAFSIVLPLTKTLLLILKKSKTF